MKFILKSIVYILFFIFTLIIFLPKEQFYYLLENKISKMNVIVSDEIIDEKLFGLNIKDANLYYDGINFSLVDNIDITTLLVYNNIDVKNIRVAKSFNKFLPSKIDSLNLNYSLINLNKISILSKGDFGEFEGEVLIFDGKIVGELKPSNIMMTKYRNLLNRFKKVDGKYIYELKF
ncbi:hypothetical protein [Halarcobacter sp.]|uniref:hypothetical protein n=1 Tax=Halarcobacter sp. TaxID=2321133 RepID=UPI0029F4C360|nr:hypothetical protein [Halarcobacter sp.]